MLPCPLAITHHCGEECPKGHQLEELQDDVGQEETGLACSPHEGTVYTAPLTHGGGVEPYQRGHQQDAVHTDLHDGSVPLN